METSSHVKVRSGHLTTSGRARVTVERDAADLAIVTITTGDLVLTASLAGRNLAQLIDALVACQEAGATDWKLLEAAS